MCVWLMKWYIWIWKKIYILRMRYNVVLEFYWIILYWNFHTPKSTVCILYKPTCIQVVWYNCMQNCGLLFMQAMFKTWINWDPNISNLAEKSNNKKNIWIEVNRRMRTGKQITKGNLCSVHVLNDITNNGLCVPYMLYASVVSVCSICILHITLRTFVRYARV